jgi:hypothetical protein
MWATSTPASLQITTRRDAEEMGSQPKSRDPIRLRSTV